MSFIPKNTPTVLNIKLTDKGRLLLSQGNLSFDKFSLGDSEIDYSIVKDFDLKPANISILQPLDLNPKQRSFVIQNTANDTGYTSIPILDNSTSPAITNSIDDITGEGYGFFQYDASKFSLKTSSDYIRQRDIIIKINEVNGSNTLKIYKSSNYNPTLLDPKSGDYIAIRWTNPNSSSTNTIDISIDTPQPLIVYKIKSVTGSMGSDNMVLTLDRNTPNFSGSGLTMTAYGYLFNLEPGSITDTTYETDFVSKQTLAFFNNFELSELKIMVWNQSNVFTENIPGISLDGKPISAYKSSGYGGFVRYIQNGTINNKNLGIIHYTNNSVENIYGESLHTNTPKLYIPYLMWHKSTSNSMGVTLQAVGDQKKLSGLDTNYYDLADESGNVVGKVFNGIKIFIIEDQELLYALSYKSSRSWTLPKPAFDVSYSTNMTDCTICELDTSYTLTPIPTGNRMVLTVNSSAGNVLLYVLDSTGKPFAVKNREADGTLVVDLGNGVYQYKVIEMDGNKCQYPVDGYASIASTTTTTTTTSTTTTTLAPTTTSTTSSTTSSSTTSSTTTTSTTSTTTSSTTSTTTTTLPPNTYISIAMSPYNDGDLGRIKGSITLYNADTQTAVETRTRTSLVASWLEVFTVTPNTTYYLDYSNVQQFYSGAQEQANPSYSFNGFDDLNQISDTQTELFNSGIVGNTTDVYVRFNHNTPV